MKNKLKLFMATAIIMIFAVQVQSQNATTPAKPAVQEKTTANPAPGAFIDKNKDGICDNFATRSGKGRGGNFVDKDNNGICDNFESGSGNVRGANYVDKNNDGICDNRTNGGKKNAGICRNGQGNQYRHGQGQGKGQRQGKGQGQGQCHGRGNCCRK